MVGAGELETAVDQVIANRYRLKRMIARGGMGTVWVAEDDKLGRDVAVKVMRRKSLEAFPDARERFEREARAAAQLRSSHVVAVHDYGVADDLPFIAMELLEGESLKMRLAREGKMSMSDTAAILTAVGKGLRAAHRAGLIHRDLKPSNIFLTQRDDAEIVKLLDFGVVKSASMQRGDEETASGVLIGTPQYMSPEQARGLRKIDLRADLWSLAVILYEMLVGQNPFDSEAEAVGDIVIRVCIDPIAPVTVMNPELPARLDAFFDKALDREPELRFQSADELTHGFMVAADVSFAGLDADSLAGARRPPVPELPDISLTSDAGATTATMSRNVEPLPTPRSRRVVVALAAVVGLAATAAIAHALLREPEVQVQAQPSVTAVPAASESPREVEAPTPSPDEPRVEEPEASAAPSSSARPTSSRGLVVPKGPPETTPPAESSSTPTGDETPRWYNEGKKK